MGSRIDVTEEKYVIGFTLAATVVAVVLAIANLPPASWINEFQGRMFGYYSRKLTALVLVLVSFGVVVVIRTLVLTIQDAGTYTRDDEPEVAYRRPRRRRRRRYEDSDSV